MLLKVFKSNQPVALFALPLVAVALWSVKYFYPLHAEYDNPYPLYEMIRYLMPDNVWVKDIIAVALILGEGILLNKILVANDFFHRSNYTTAFVFILISCGFPYLLQFHPLLFANLFLLLSLRRIFSLYRQTTALSPAFDAGLFIGIASLFHFPLVVVFPFVWVCFIMLRPFVWREWILSLIGGLLPWGFLFLYYFIAGSEVDTESFKFLLNEEYMILTSSKLINGVILAFFGWFLINAAALLAVSMKSSTLKARKLKRVMMYLFLFLIVSYVLSGMNVKAKYDLAILTVPLATFLGYYFYNAQKKRLMTLFFYLFLLVIGTNIYLLLTN